MCLCAVRWAGAACGACAPGLLGALCDQQEALYPEAATCALCTACEEGGTCRATGLCARPGLCTCVPRIVGADWVLAAGLIEVVLGGG